jgi:hypothetical protein
MATRSSSSRGEPVPAALILALRALHERVDPGALSGALLRMGGVAVLSLRM